jgi:hypothetical protein
MRRLVFLLIGLSISLAAMAHAYHASIMDVRYNAQKQQLEIALKVFTDDFEKALSQGQPKPISLLQMPATQTKPITAAYLARTLRFGTKPGETLPLTYLGMQHEGDAHWLYCTVKLPRALKSLTLHHKLLLDQFSDEMNIVNLEAGGKKQSTLFRSGEEEQTFTW